MNRAFEIDLPQRLKPFVPPVITQLGVATICLFAGFAVRQLMDMISPGAAPFALIFPAVMLATLFAGLLAGFVTMVVAILFAWYVVLPVPYSFEFADPAGPSILLVVTLASLLTLAIAVWFRESVKRAHAERDRQIAEKDLFLQEFDHRVKNNFAIVASLLDLQRRRAGPETAEALSVALMRVESIARAHRHLYRGNNDVGAVEMGEYLSELCAALGDAVSLRAGVTLVCESDAVQMPRDRAVSIGLVVNELVTNAAKHAFAGRERGTISVRFNGAPGGWRLVVADDGTGMPDAAPKADRDGGLGTRLIDAFARQAGGTIDTRSGPDGTAVTLALTA